MIIDQTSAVFPKVQSISRTLFGNQDRLIVAAAVAEAEAGSIYGRRLAEDVGIVDARIGPQLAAFEAAGLLVRLPKVGGERRAYFERRESAFWALCVKLCQEVVDAE